MAPTASPAPSPAKVRLCADGCGGVLPRGTQRKYLEGHAPNYARALDTSSLSKASIAAFWGQVRVAQNAMCWEWMGSRLPSGYGIFTDPVTRKRYRAHRLAHAFLRGPLHPGELTLHRCDVLGLGASCLNPWHTFQGTASDNGLDAAANGLLARKLSASQVLEIRALRQSGAASRAAIAAQFGTSGDNVYKITSGRTWLHLLESEAPPLSARRPWILKAACLRGHGFTPENTTIGPKGERRCRACQRLASERHRRLTQPNPAPLKRLTADIVRAIRAKAVAGVIDGVLAREFGIAPQTVHEIVNRLSWRHLDPDAPTPLPTRARKVTCRRGHELTPENTRQTSIQRVCRTCQRDYMRAHRARKREAA